MDPNQPVQQITQLSPIIPPQPTPTLPPPPSIDSGNGHSSNPMLFFLVIIGTLLLGSFLGYFIPDALGIKQESTLIKSDPQDSIKQELTLPADAVQIQACSDKKGTLYVRPSDIPTGPVYLVYKQKVIGIEYMLGKDEFLNGKSYKFLNGAGAKINYVNVGLVSQGHEGYTQPHYHVDLYVVDKDIPESIKCETTGFSPEATSGALIVPSTSPLPSSMPSPQASH